MIGRIRRLAMSGAAKAVKRYWNQMVVVPCRVLAVAESVNGFATRQTLAMMVLSVGPKILPPPVPHGPNLMFRFAGFAQCCLLWVGPCAHTFWRLIGDFLREGFSPAARGSTALRSPEVPRRYQSGGVALIHRLYVRTFLEPIPPSCNRSPNDDVGSPREFEQHVRTDPI